MRRAAAKLQAERHLAEGLAWLRKRSLAAKAARTWPRRAAGRARDFFGSDGGFIFYGGLPLGSLGKVSGLTDGLELAASVKVIAILAGWVVQFSLRIVAYVVGRDPERGSVSAEAKARGRIEPGPLKAGSL